MLAEHFVHDAVLLRLVGGHEEVALDILSIFSNSAQYSSREPVQISAEFKICFAVISISVA